MILNFLRREVDKSSAVDVRQHGARGDGQSDDTDAFMQALAAVPKGGTLHVPAGEYRVRYAEAGARFGGLQVPDGCQLVGDGPDKTIIKGIGQSVTSQFRGAFLIVIGAEAHVADLTVDGDKDAFDRRSLGNFATFLLQTAHGGSGVTFENVHVRNQYAQDREGSGINISEASNCVLRGIEAYDNDGSGLSVGTSNVFESRPEHTLFEQVRCYRNGWQGITAYGAKGVEVKNAEAFENARHGLNCEWSEDVTFQDCHSANNGRRGLRVTGGSRNVRFENVVAENDGAGYPHGAELMVGTQPFPVANPQTGAIEARFPEGVQLVNCALKPAPNRPHVILDRGYSDASNPAQSIALPRNSRFTQRAQAAGETARVEVLVPKDEELRDRVHMEGGDAANWSVVVGDFSSPAAREGIRQERLAARAAGQGRGVQRPGRMNRPGA